MKHVMILMVLTLGSIALAQSGGVGNGGAVMVCRQLQRQVTSVRLFDFWESSNRFNSKFVIDMGKSSHRLGSDERVYDLVENVLKRLESVDSDHAQSARQIFEEFKGEVLNITDDAQIKKLFDLGQNPNYAAALGDYIGWSENCEYKNAIVQKKNPLPGDARYLRNPKLWNELVSDEHRAGLVLHEIFYRLEIARGATVSQAVRPFISRLSSSDAKSLRPLDLGLWHELYGVLHPFQWNHPHSLVNVIKTEPCLRDPKARCLLGDATDYFELEVPNTRKNAPSVKLLGKKEILFNDSGGLERIGSVERFSFGSPRFLIAGAPRLAASGEIIDVNGVVYTLSANQDFGDHRVRGRAAVGAKVRFHSNGQLAAIEGTFALETSIISDTWNIAVTREFLPEGTAVFDQDGRLNAIRRARLSFRDSTQETGFPLSSLEGNLTVLDRLQLSSLVKSYRYWAWSDRDLGFDHYRSYPRVAVDPPKSVQFKAKNSIVIRLTEKSLEVEP